MKAIKNIKRCYNCKYASDAFNTYYTTHIHCHKPEYEDMYKRGEITSGWETLRVFSSNCDDFVAKGVNKKNNMKTKPVEALKIIDENWDKGGTPKNLKIADMIACNVAFKEGKSNPKIKQLEWEDDVLFTDIIVSDGFSLLFYMINIIDNTLHIGDMSQSFNTIEEAKAFAQSDFEARVKECLTTK